MANCTKLLKECAVPSVVAEVHRKMFMPEARNQDLFLWFPGVVARSPRVTFSFLTAMSSRAAHKRMKVEVGKKVIFIATGASLRQLGDAYGAAAQRMLERIMLEACGSQ